jgi:predicted RNA binding protein YcfA (HicA-like mRNA interferase family)
MRPGERDAESSEFTAPRCWWMPPKIRELIAQLERAGFVDRGGKGSHRNFVHPKRRRRITISGAPGDDAMPYQLTSVAAAIKESKS